MKKLFSLFTILILISSCTGDQGPQGPPGFDGFDGQDGELALAFETPPVSFTATTNFEAFFEFQQFGINVFPNDVALVYRLKDTFEGQPVWQQIPQTVIFDDGSFFVYNSDFTVVDLRIFLEDSVNLNSLGAEWTQNQIFRVVVVPAESARDIDNSNLNEVMGRFDITSFEKLD